MAKDTLLTFEALAGFPDLCFLLDAAGTIRNANTAAREAFNHLSNQLEGMPFTSLLHPASVLKAEHALIRCLEGESAETEGRLRIDDTLAVDTSFYFSAFGFGTRKQPRVLVIAKDITEQKKNEVELLRFFYVAEHTVNPLQITDLGGKMIYVNPAFERLSGYTKEELIGNNPSVFGSGRHSRTFWDRMWHTISSGKEWIGEVENKKKNNESIYTELLISPIVNKDKNVIGYFGIHRDLTEKRNLEKQLIHTQKMESIGTLAAGVAHEVGNPLASISALVQIIQRSTDDNFIKEKLELVKKQINRISKIIRDLVDFSRPSNYELKLTDINENLRESIEIVRVGKKAKNIEFTSELSESLDPLHLVADQIQQVFVNILINAVDAILERQADSSDTLEGRIAISSSVSGGKVVITFSDNGVGISDDNSAKIFEPFFTTKKEGKGTGLGLWVSYGIIKSFQGDIIVESKPFVGTRFTIWLPLHPVF